MIRRKIPSTYEFDATEVINAIRSVIGNVYVSVSSNGIVEIDVASLSPAQQTAIKNAVVEFLKTPPLDITM